MTSKKTYPVNACRVLPVLVLAFMVSGCSSTLDKLEGIGKPPSLAKLKDPTTDGDYRPLTWPLPETAKPVQTASNSLWQPGARTFFRDGRASRVGDILRVKISLTDQAEFTNTTTSSSSNASDVKAPTFLGAEKKLGAITPIITPNPASLVDITGSRSLNGNVSAKRKETVQTQVAAMVTQVLPNGNFAIQGKQEFLMNYDIREVSIRGVVRPQDIGSDNTVDSTQVAEARITYGGRGQNMDMQQKPWGAQAVDAISPF